MGTHYHGKHGKVQIGSSVVNEGTDWDMTIDADNEQYPFFGAAWKAGLVGAKGASGTINLRQDFAAPIDVYALVGTAITIQLYETTTPSGAAVDMYWSIPALITSLAPAVSVAGGVTATVGWISDGEITVPSRS